MALTPIPYTKNWSDVFGSQAAPADTPAKIEAPVATLSNVNGRRASWTISPCTIDWGDGSAEEVHAATGVISHTYSIGGFYKARAYPAGSPDCYTEQQFEVTDDPQALRITHVLSDNTATLTIIGAVYPITISDGIGGAAKGNSFFIPYPSFLPSPVTVTFPSPGAYRVEIYDALGRRATDTVTVMSMAPPVPPASPAPPPDTPWGPMTRHAELDAYLAESDTVQPEGWATMTIAEKKAWLDENF